MKKEKRLRSRGRPPPPDTHLRLGYLKEYFKKKRRKQKKTIQLEKRLIKLREVNRAKYGPTPMSLREKQRMHYTHQKITLRTDGFGLVLPKLTHYKAMKRIRPERQSSKQILKRGPGRPRKIKKTIIKPPRVLIPGLELERLEETREEEKAREERKRQSERRREDLKLQEDYEKHFGSLHEGLSAVSFFSRWAFNDRYAVLLGREDAKGEITLKKMKIKDMYQNYPGTLQEYLQKVDALL